MKKHILNSALALCLAGAAAIVQAAPPQAKSGFIPNRYIVVLDGEPAALTEGRLVVAKGQLRARRPNAPAVLARRAEIRLQQARMTTLIEASGGRVKASVDTVLNALIVDTANPAAIRGIAGVKSVHQDRMMRAKLDRVLALSNVPQAFAQIGGPQMAGVGMRIGILDTGIDTTHPGFQDSTLTPPAGSPQTTPGSEALATSKVIVVRSYQDLIASPTYGTDGSDVNGHGTNAACAAACVQVVPPLVAAGISGVAPKAFLGSYKVLGNDGSGGGAATIKALDDAVKDGMDVVNLSLGSDIAGDPTTDVQAMAVNNAVQAGAVACVAAGNAGPDENTMNSPGTAELAITVGSSSSDRVLNADGTTTPLDPNQISSFSSRGPNLGAGLKPDMVAVGDNFYTASSTLKDPTTLYTITQGTSFATPAVAGGVALIKAARPGFTALQYRSLLINSSATINLAGAGPAAIRWQGAGRMDVFAALNTILVSDTTSVKFGPGDGNPNLSPTLNLTNLGTVAANVTLTVVPFTGTTAPTLSSSTLALAPGASGPITVTLAGSGLTGETQGFIVATNDQNSYSTTIPYWYATMGSPANAIAFLELPTAPTAAQPTVFAARVLDGAGLAVSDPPLTAQVTNGTGQVLSVTLSPDVPNTYNVTLQLSTGQVTVQFSAGAVTRNQTFTVQ